MNSGAPRRVTRREVLGAGLALAAVSGAIGWNAACAARVVKDQTGLPKLGALVLDEDLGVSTGLVEFLHNRKPDLPLLSIRLDSFTSIQLKHMFGSARMIAGISCGATLFCLERIAWDYGYRVTRRSEHEFNAEAASALENDATVLALAHAITSNEPASFAAEIASTSRAAYSPSTVDGTLHAWIMQTAAISRRTV